MATREDNPFKPELQAYGLEFYTMDTGSAGTNADLKFKLNGCRGSSELIYNTGFVHPTYSTGRMEANQADWATIPSLNLGKLTSLEITNFGGGFLGAPDWDLGEVSVASARWISPTFLFNEKYTATYNNTVEAGHAAKIDLHANFNLPLPTIECPAPITVNNAPGKCNAVVNFAPKVEGLCPDVTAESKPPSGSIFDVGTTNVSSTRAQRRRGFAVVPAQSDGERRRGTADRVPRSDDRRMPQAPRRHGRRLRRSPPTTVPPPSRRRPRLAACSRSAPRR